MTLNLVNQDTSEIKYKISRFPDGQQQVSIIGECGSSVQIKSRLNDFIDLELIICATKSLRSLGIFNIELYVPYFLGSRSDRSFTEGECNYLKDVICPIVNSLNFQRVSVIDPHSDVLEACLYNYNKTSNLDLIRWVFMNHPQNTWPINDFILISPDAGACKKIYKVAEQIGFNGEILTCSKDRDTNGNLTKTSIPDFKSIVNTGYAIIDDICDGGGTFINIAKIIKPLLHESSKLYLIVTHGIFSKGLKELSEYFDGIYCTNSYRDINSMNEFGMRNERFLHKIKQLNIF